jgi:hypothetical protein
LPSIAASLSKITDDGRLIIGQGSGRRVGTPMTARRPVHPQSTSGHIMLFNLIREAIGRWKDTAFATFRVLDAWRDDPGVYFEYQARYKGIHKSVVRKFISGTATLIQEAKNLSLDPRPIQAFSDAVDSWHHQHNADRVPDQGRLSAMLEAALATVQEIEDGIRQREVEQRRIQGARSIAPVTSNGRMHTNNGAATSEVLNVSPPPEPVFIPNDRQKAMLDALKDRALRSDAWAECSKVDKKSVMDQKKELERLGLVRHHARLGFYRPDAPPPELVGHQKPTK